MRSLLRRESGLERGGGPWDALETAAHRYLHSPATRDHTKFFSVVRFAVRRDPLRSGRYIAPRQASVRSATLGDDPTSYLVEDLEHR